MLDDRTLQTWLHELGYYQGRIDGQPGEVTQLALEEMEQAAGLDTTGWSKERKRMAAEQLFLQEHGFPTEIDGLYGRATEEAHAGWIRQSRDGTPADAQIEHQPQVWPRQKDVPAFYGEKGKHQVMLDLPYLMYYDKTPVRRISLHEKVAPSARRVLEKTLAHYGTRVSELGLDKYSGSLNVRQMRGGSAWSMHSWGIAIDFDAGNNALNWDHTRAKLARPECKSFFDFWYEEGWISLGRERDFDWMHVQAARL